MTLPHTGCVPAGMRAIIEGDTDVLVRAVSAYLCSQLQQILQAQEQVVFGVPGGRSVARIFDHLIQEEIDWRRVQLFLVDERCVPPEHPESNYRLMHEHAVLPLRQRGAMGMGTVHPFVYDAPSADQGAGRYTELLAAYGLRFDLVLLSMGEDGHVASLFPHHAALSVACPCFVGIHDAPKPPLARISASLPLLRTAQAVALVVLGEGKRAALASLCDPAVLWTDCPAKGVVGTPECVLFTDVLLCGAGRG